MDDDENIEDEEFVVEIPAYPFVQSAAIADVLEMAATVCEAQAELLRSFAERAAADHNNKVFVEQAMSEAAQELEQIVKDGGETNGDS